MAHIGMDQDSYAFCQCDDVHIYSMAMMMRVNVALHDLRWERPFEHQHTGDRRNAQNGIALLRHGMHYDLVYS